MPQTAIIGDSRVRSHDPGPGHPEQPARYQAVMNRLAVSGLLDQALRLEGRIAADDELSLVHPKSYIDLVEREVAQDRRQLSTGDTAVDLHSAEAARIA